MNWLMTVATAVTVGAWLVSVFALMRWRSERKPSGTRLGDRAVEWYVRGTGLVLLVGLVLIAAR